MGAEVDERVGFEMTLRPLVGTDVSLGRILVGSMDNLERVGAFAAHQLGQQRHISKDHGLVVIAMLLYAVLQLLGTGGQTAEVVALGVHAFQPVIQGRCHLHARRRERACAGTLVIIDGHPLAMVGLGLQSDVVSDGLDKRVEPLRNGKGLMKSVLAHAVREDDIGPDGAVDLGNDDALRQESAHHALLVVLPVVDEAVHVERREHGDVGLFEIAHQIVADAPVGHVDDGRGADGVDVMVHDKLTEPVHPIDREALTFKPIDQRRGDSHHSGDQNARRMRAIEAVAAQESVVVGHRVEAQFIVVGVLRVDMQQHVVGPQLHHIRLNAAEFLAVDELSDVVEHAAIVAAAAVFQILPQEIAVHGVDGVDVVGRIRDQPSEGGHGQRGLAQLFALRGVELKAHRRDHDHVVVLQFVQVFHVHLSHLDGGVVVGLGDLSQLDGLVVDEGYPRGTNPMAPSVDGEDHEKKQPEGP